MNLAKGTVAAAFLMVVAYISYESRDILVGFIADLTSFLSLAMRACLGTVLLGLGVLCLWWVRRQSHEANRQRDGAFPLREYYVEPWTKRLVNALTLKPSPKVILDVNAMMTHGAMIYQGIHQFEPAAGWDRQLTYMQTIEATRKVQAITPGDAVLGNPFVSLQRGVAGVANASTGKFLSGAWDKQPKQITVDGEYTPEPEPLPQLPAPELTAYDAVTQSTPLEIVMGQTPTGGLVRWNPARVPHLRVHGKSQRSGKTNFLQMLAASALRMGHHVVVCDRVNFKDWRRFESCAELVDTRDPKMLVGAFEDIYTLYEDRMERLGQLGAANILEMPKPPKRIIVVIGEFGAQMIAAKNAGAKKDIVNILEESASIFGAAGIHFVAEDQVADAGWTPRLKTNFSAVIGNMPSHMGQKCGHPGNDGGTNMFPLGTFWYEDEGTIIKTPHMASALVDILQPVPSPKRMVVRTQPATITVMPSTPAVNVAAVQPNTPVVPSVPAVPAVPSVPTGVGGGGFTPITPPIPGNVPQGTGTGTVGTVNPGRYDAVVAAWFAANPQALTGPAKGISDLARAMCRDNEGDESNYQSYKGYASRLFEAYRKDHAKATHNPMPVSVNTNQWWATMGAAAD